MDYYQKLQQQYQKISHFNHLAAVCSWDQAAMMPAGGNDARGAAMAELALHIHQLSTAPQLAEWFDNASQQSLSPLEQASLREMQRRWQWATVIPEDLVAAKALAGSKCEHAWRSQREKNDWAGFSVNFATMVALSQEEAQIRGETLQLTPYDGMLDYYEPGMTSAQLDRVFGEVKTWLPDLTQQIIDKQASENYLPATGYFAIEQQRQLGLAVMKMLGFDFNHGRLDVSMHPFCGGTPTDIRITTCYDEKDFVGSLMGVVHETGHARYEQGLPKHLINLPVGEARSMGIHESQSLFFEMQLGRSEQFIQLLSPLVQQYFPDFDQAIFSPTNLNMIYNRVKPGYIRIYADEVTYPAHILLRYEIERDLMNKTIRYQDIPELWHEKMQAYLGLSTRGNDKNGCMQDIHWTDGSFGYFPSYSLGAMYAAQFMAAMQREINVPQAISNKDFQPIFSWLEQHIWQQGSLLSTNELLVQATGEPLNSQYFKQHLSNRYLG